MQCLEAWDQDDFWNLGVLQGLRLWRSLGSQCPSHSHEHAAGVPASVSPLHPHYLGLLILSSTRGVYTASWKIGSSRHGGKEA